MGLAARPAAGAALQLREHGTVCLIQLMSSAESLFRCNLRGKLNASYFQVILNPEGDTIVLVLPGAFLRGLGFVTVKLGTWKCLFRASCIDCDQCTRASKGLIHPTKSTGTLTEGSSSDPA